MRTRSATWAKDAWPSAPTCSRTASILRAIPDPRCGPGWQRAVAHLPGELTALAAQHAIPVTRVSIRDQQSRWGSCSRRGTISLNWRLVQTPPFVREYVLLHELMHRRELNHSAHFWRLLAAACPRYVEARMWLRETGATLF